MSTIANQIQTPINPNQLAINAKFDHKTAAVGKGLGAVGGDLPPTQPGTPAFSSAIQSLSAFMGGGAKIDTDVLLVQVAVAMRDVEAMTQKKKIDTDQETKKAQLKEKEAKLEEAQKKMEEAESKGKGGSIFDKVKLAFEWLAAIAAIVAAVALIATGGGAVVGTAMVVAAGASLVMAVDSTVTMATGQGIAGNLAKLGGASEEESAKADMGFKISMAAIGIIAAIVGGGASIVSAVKTIASSSVQVAQQATTQVAKMVTVGTNATQTVGSAGNAAAQTGSTVLHAEAARHEGEAKGLEAEAKKYEAAMQMLDDFIDQALSRLMASSDRFNLMLDGIMEAVSDRSDTLSRARFSG